MFVKSLELKNFRNYDDLSMTFDKDNNILFGDNAQGKTNVLEAVYVSGTTKSHKGSKDKELIKIGENEAHIRLIVNKNGIDRKIDMHLRKNKSKGVAIDGLPIKKSMELCGLINIIFFSPENLNIIKNGPSERRRFIDMELCQIDKFYLDDLYKYNKVINQRNNLLKQINVDKSNLETLTIWDEQLVSYGNKIIKRRKDFVDELNDIVNVIHKKLSGDKEDLKLVYEPNITEQAFEEKLFINRDRDIILKSTSVGPHRDDIGFLINEIDVRKFGSQGQQRTAALSLNLAELELVKNKINDNPILLLDDVLSELDRNRQNYLLNSLEGIQTIITCTGLEEFINNRFNVDKIYKVEKGKIKIVEQ
jgi:DNA replication and repair protein RecF